MEPLCLPTDQQVPIIFESVMRQVEFAMGYVGELLDATPRDRWFEIPEGMPCNIAWQVGHLTVAQYGLLLFRIRGRADGDMELMPSKFRKMYGKQSVPSADPAKQPTADELLDRLKRVWQTANDELPPTDLSVLSEPEGMPYAAYPTKLGALMFSPLHLQIHAGQIGLIRRGLGLEPIR